ncbi:Glucose/arabinose dehydrogenase, beta-propeller fold [Reichenbachiella faecimaris]|uniref:Glucose/arabinose dehydrogenase, beta-propeller fold n=1 Tax=Reichenbachiella faecimaris TaxID=692418 RepID=A0A1W2GPT3_REIFA|nr:sorbosone dehydrogenase family protein [Reichenbachiella faecimaris]SMD38601.1 Glucose/arabinose dehydrogenase, beta-propeller fold [Reichenbachiella faecimaris]
MRYFQLLVLLILSAFSFYQCESTPKSDNPATEVEESLEDATLTEALKKIKLPDGFSISLYSDNVPNARSMTLSPSGVLYVGTRQDDKVYALEDTNGDHVADTKYIIAENMNTPNGVAFNDGDLYVAEINKIWKFVDIESNLNKIKKPVLISDEFPSDKHHGWKYIAFGPDDKLYVPVGAPCNICESKKEIYASITRMNKDGSAFEIFANGVRNTVGFTWHPETKEMWFTDNGRDLMGDDMPPCELNHAPKAGMHFGYPYCHGGDIADPTHGGEYSCTDFTAPAQKLGPHVAPLGLKFYTGNMFPEEYKNDIFIAEHGSWNRSSKIGYRIMRIKMVDGKASGYEPFVYGWLDEEAQEAFGRPVDVLVMPDGAMLVSDDRAGVIYRITYSAD